MRRSVQIGRIVRVQGQLREIAEGQLRAAEARRDQLEAVRRFIFQSLASDDPQDRALAAMAGDRLRWVERDMSEVEALHRDILGQWQKIVQKELAAQRLCKRICLEEEAVSAERKLDEIIENLANECASLR